MTTSPHTTTFVRAGLQWLSAAALSLTALAAGAQPAAAPGAGFADPQGAPRLEVAAEASPARPAAAVDTLATVRNRGTLRVGVAVNEPMVMHDRQGALVGYSIDLARRLADDLGVQVEFVETSWSQIVPELLARRFDVISSGLWVTLPRALVVNFTDVAASQGIHLVSGRSAATRRSVADFDRPGTRIVVYAGTQQEQVATRLFPRATLVKVSGDSDHLLPVLAGQAHAALVPTVAPQLLLRAAPGKLFLPLAQPLSQSITAMAIRKGDADFLSYLNTWLAVHRAEGWLEERAHHWSAANGTK